MKKLSFLFILILLFTNLSLSAQYAYDDESYDDSYYPGYLGDDFSLEGALEVFKNARSIENFEFDINNQDRYVNNLDLNNDGRIDFIRVTDQSENRNVRLVVMQAILGKGDIQDIAVIAVEKTGRRSATLQIIGDEYLFGPEMIVEPTDIEYNQNRYDRGPSGDINVSRFFINVWYWPCVRSIFRSNYRYYRSPYYWDYYPRVWNPWRPFGYSTYYNRCGRYRTGFYRITPTIRIVYVNNYYRPRRTCSVRVRNRYERHRHHYRGHRDGRGNNINRRSYSQTKPERRSKHDEHRERVAVNVKDTRGAQSGRPAKDVKKARGAHDSKSAVRPNGNIRNEKKAYESKPSRPTRDVRTEKKSQDHKVNKPSRDVRSDRSSRDYKANKPANTIRKESKSNDRKAKSSKPTKRSDRSSYSKPAPSKSNTSSYSKKSRSSSAAKSSKRSNDSNRKSSVKSAPKKSRSSASRKSTSRSSNAQKKSSSSRSKANKPSKRGSKF